ncbi:O-antigen ligase family protein [Massilia agilis]|uniref:O-antigen ligase family protein n=1 Tax=Massilia agilis TaxID=1811226 RepID=A0ABT2DED3_9BURK|nr:O-antigen ligase family protein [Massilia agilis]MCS0809591.1 O-antigen ligase family protein [Massilia agilis]
MLLSAALFANFAVVAGHDFQRVVEIAALLCAGAWLLASRSDVPGRLFAGAVGKTLAAFFLFGLLSSVLAREPRLAAFETSIFFLLYAIAIAAGAEIAKCGLPALVRILQIVAIAGVLYTLKFFVAYFGSFHLGIALEADDFTPGFSNIRFFNHVQTSTLPLLVLLCSLTPRTSRLRWLWLAVTAYWWMALYATTGRGTLAGMAAACAAAAFLLRGAALPYLRQVALTAILGVVAYVVLLVIVPALLGAKGIGAFAFAVERTVANPASGRMPLWRQAVTLILQHPLLGVGPMHFAHFGRPVHQGAHPHDWLLQIASEWGLPALVCLLAALSIALRALVRAPRHVDAHDRDNRAVAAAMLVGAVAILVDGLVSGVLVMPQSQLGIALYLACATGWYRTVVPATRVSGAGRTARVVGAVLFVGAMAGLANLLPDGLARLRAEPLSPALEAVNAGPSWPRLWKEGYF